MRKYHQEGYSGYKEISLPYSIEKRIKVLKKYSKKDGVFAEVGGDAPHDFHVELKKLFSTCINIEIARDIPSKYRSLEDLKKETVDVLVHYDVLEHVLEIKKFLKSCHHILKTNGLMICEVPNIRLYPKNLLMLEFEHVNHFSANTLSCIAAQVGFELIDLGFDCSRPHGFLSVFKKRKNPVVSNYNLKLEFIKSLASLKGGIDQIETLEKQFSDFEVKISQALKSNKKVTIWAVNDLLRRLLERIDIDKKIVIVDSDPRRKDHLFNLGITVDQPENKLRHIEKTDLLIISAARYKSEILDWIFSKTNKIFNEKNLIVLGESKFLGTLS